MIPTLRRCMRCSNAVRSSSILARLQSGNSALSRHIEISEEVRDALHRSQAIVSLETAITSHGLPYDQAISTANSLDNIIRKNGAVPAVIGILDGKITIGLDRKDIQRLAASSSEEGTRREKWKVGRRDIVPAIVKKVDGGTTVSATSFLSNLVGIDVFVTGGIGGVHRGAQQTMDISSDLTELSHTRTAIICAGAKSILDIGLTLEYLETLGVTVTTFGPTTDFPAFYARKSGFQAPFNVRTASEAARLLYLSKVFDEKSGTLIGVPIPVEYEEKSIVIQQAVEQAVRESEENGIAKKGKEVTPWLLARVKELTGGTSVESNIALIEKNARVGAGIAVELARMVQEGGDVNLISGSRSYGSSIRTSPIGKVRSSPGQRNFKHKRLAVVGAAAVDIVAQPFGPTQAGTTVPGRTDIRLGGVARNVHEAAYKAGAEDAILIAPMGTGGDNDPLSEILRHGLASLGASQEGLIEMEGQTPSVSMILGQNGTLENGVAAMSLLDSYDILPKQIEEKLTRIKPDIICFDGNLHYNCILTLLHYCQDHKCMSAFEPTSDEKALKLHDAWYGTEPAQTIEVGQVTGEPLIDHFLPNLQELRKFGDHAQNGFNDTSYVFRDAQMLLRKHTTSVPGWFEEQDAQRIHQALCYARMVWVKLGSEGLAVFQTYPRNAKERELHVDVSGITRMVIHGKRNKVPFNILGTIFKPLTPTGVKNSIGAGDSMLGGILAGLTRGLNPFVDTDLIKLANLGQRAAIAALASETAVGDLSEVRRALQ